MNSFKYLAVAIFLFLGPAHAIQPPEQLVLEKFFEDGKYNPNFRPVNKNNISQPVVVSVNFFVRSIDSVDSIKGEWSTQLTFRQQWQDDRLKFDNSRNNLSYVSLTRDPTQKVWIPDLFFSNEKEAHLHNLMVNNQYVRIYPNGEVLYSTRLSLRLSCPMVFKKFPMDTQSCSIRIASYGYTTKDIVLKWKEQDPVQVTSMLVLYDFSLDFFSTDHCDSQTNTGIYSCLRTDFLFKRSFNQYLIHLYIPCTMLVLMSFATFWISSLRQATARLIIVTMTLLSLSFFVAQANKGYPTVQYTRMVDVWTGICLTFVFGAVLESITAVWLRGKRNREDDGDEQGIPLNNIGGNGIKFTKRLRNLKMSNLPDKLDAISRLLFPVLFLIFVIVYWAAIKEKSDKE